MDWCFGIKEFIICSSSSEQWADSQSEKSRKVKVLRQQQQPTTTKFALGNEKENVTVDGGEMSVPQSTRPKEE